MSRDGLLIGEVAKQSGASRKALRLYEERRRNCHGEREDVAVPEVRPMPRG